MPEEALTEEPAVDHQPNQQQTEVKPDVQTNDDHSVMRKEIFQQLLENTKHTMLSRTNSNEFQSGHSKLLEQKQTKSYKIQKQISLYEKDHSTEYKKLVHDVDSLTRSPSKMKIQKRWIGGGSKDLPHTNFVSADNLQLLQSATLVCSKDDTKKINPQTSSKLTGAAAGDKTKSCMNLKAIAGGSNPGAVVVKEKFIEPPLRVAKSFHGNTSFANKYKSTVQKSGAELGCGVSADSVFNAGKTNRFIATKVNEDENVEVAAANNNECDQQAENLF